MTMMADVVNGRKLPLFVVGRCEQSCSTRARALPTTMRGRRCTGTPGGARKTSFRSSERSVWSLGADLFPFSFSAYVTYVVGDACSFVDGDVPSCHQRADDARD